MWWLENDFKFVSNSQLLHTFLLLSKIETKFKVFCPSFKNLTHAFVVLITIICNKTYTYSCFPYFSALTCILCFMNQLLRDYSEWCKWIYRNMCGDSVGSRRIRQNPLTQLRLYSKDVLMRGQSSQLLKCWLLISFIHPTTSNLKFSLGIFFSAFFCTVNKSKEQMVST